MSGRGVTIGIALWVALVVGLGALPALAGLGPDDVAALVEGNNAFALDLYGELAGEDGNLFFSPYSVSSALGMTYAGARERTAQQMAQTLHFGLEPVRLHTAFGDLTKRLTTPGKSYQLTVANALWGQAGLKFQPDFLATTKRYYDSGFQEVDYVRNTEQARQTINRWVERKTNRKIVDLLKPGVLNNLTRLVLTNAIYFKGSWEAPFRPDQTRELPFFLTSETKRDVPTMYRTGKAKYMEDDRVQVLELLYSGGELAMDLVLPRSPRTLADLEKGLTLAELHTWLSGVTPRTVDVYLPRFKLETAFSLKRRLMDLGTLDAFSEQAADFSGMSPTFLYITAVIHKAFVEVNEAGTEAAAATAVVMGTKSAMMDLPVEFRADHPFLFLIRDLRSGSILFLGRLADPSGK